MSRTGHEIIERPDLRGRSHVFRDRANAGAVLAEMLAAHIEHRSHAMVLAIPAGGVPVAVPIAERLALPLDLAVVSKITLPWNPEMGYGAVAFDGSVCLNDPLLRQIGLSKAQVEAGIAHTRDKVARRNADLRRGRDYVALSGADTVLVDDGLASGFTMRAAIAAVQAAGAATITVAAPTGHESAAQAIAGSVEAVYCANVCGGQSFAVAEAYVGWSDVDEETVRTILSDFGRGASPPASTR